MTATRGEPEDRSGGIGAGFVGDRPLDHPFTYGVGEDLHATIAVGKRVLVPFGRGDRATVGYCVRLSDTPPDRPGIKDVLSVLDEDALLTDNLLRLTLD